MVEIKRDHRIIVTWKEGVFRNLAGKVRDCFPRLTKSEANEISKIYKVHKWVESVDVQHD